MPIKLIGETIKKAEKDFRKLLPLEKRDFMLDKLDTKDIMVNTLNIVDFNRFIENWENFLNNLDKFWNQLNNYKIYNTSDDKKEILNGFLGNINKNRTTDEVLIFLDKARNNSQHTLWRHIRKSESIEVFAGKGAIIKFLTNGIQVTGNGDSAKQVTIMFKEGVILLNHVKVVEFKKEVIYELPTSCFNYLFTPMERAIPQLIGLFGLKYYLNIFEEFKAKC